MRFTYARICTLIIAAQSASRRSTMRGEEINYRVVSARRFRRRALFGAIIAAMFCAYGGMALDAHAQSVPQSVFYPPTFESIDQNGVDLISGKINIPISTISIGETGNGLKRTDFGLRDIRDSNLLRLQITYGYPGGDPVKQDKEFLFQVSGNGWSSEYPMKDSDYPNDFIMDSHGTSLAASQGHLVFTSRDGDIVIFQPDSCGNAYCAGGGTRILRPISWTKPDGEVITYYNGSYGTIVSNEGWMLRVDNLTSSVRRSMVNTAIEPNYCDPSSSNICSFLKQWPSVTESYSGTDVRISSDALGNVSSINLPTNSWGVVCDGNGHTSSETFAYYGFITAGGKNTYIQVDGASRVKSLTNSNGTWTYEYSDDSGEARNCDNKLRFDQPHVHTVKSTDPDGNFIEVTSDTKYGHIISVVDEKSRETSYIYFSTFPDPLAIKFPELNEIHYVHDSRWNITEIVYLPKPNSGLQSTSVFSAGYDATCASRAKCNKPNWTKDALGNQTDYTYDDTTGLTLTITRPADSSGIRPITAYSYQQIATYSRNSSGSLSQTGSIWKPTVTATCNKTAGTVVISGLTSTLTCGGGAADLMLTTTSYAGSFNALPTAVTQASGDGVLTATTSYGYDDHGNQISIDGPRTDVVDKSYRTYDILRRPIFEVAPDPDGAGPLKRIIVHHLYDADSREIRTETGTGNATDGSDFVVTSFEDKTYDSMGQLVKTVVGWP